jgi:transposase-like protein
MTDTKKDNIKKKHPGGRPPIRYDPELHPAFAKALAIDGLTHEEIAKRLGCSEDTLRKWRKLYHEFSGALKEGKEHADAKVEMSLYKRAIGYEYTETKTIKTPDGTKTEIKGVHVSPDPTSCIFWLKNRRPSEWRDSKQLEHSGKDGETITVKVLKGVGVDELL